MKAFLFDLDDTLYDISGPFIKAYEVFFAERIQVDIEKLFTLSRQYSNEKFEASQNGTISMEELYIYRMQKPLQDLGVFISAEEALEFQQIYQSFQKKILLSEEMKNLLNDCREKVCLGIITNGPRGNQWNKVKALGVEKWIPKEHIFVSGELHVAKPDRRIFEHAEEKMEVNSTECYFIGDSIENDIVGATNAGWRSVWFNQRKEKNDGNIIPDYEVDTEQELHTLLMKLCEE